MKSSALWITISANAVACVPDESPTDTHGDTTTTSGSTSGAESAAEPEQPIVPRRCGSELPPDAIALAEADIAARPAPGLVGETRAAIPVWFHVIYNEIVDTDEGDTNAGTGPGTGIIRVGNVCNSRITRQMQVLNASFAGSGFSFVLAGTTRTDAAEWRAVEFGSPEEFAMKSSLGTGGPGTLNVYVIGTPIADDVPVLGFSSFPWQLEQKKRGLAVDGVVLLEETIPKLEGADDDCDNNPDPNGPFAPYILGDTLVHEVGHWLGLYHTFQGACNDRRGDFVDDTPAEKFEAFYCFSRDTCPKKPGLDPVKNFMNYSHDNCMDHFTAGQVARMQSLIALYRGL